MRTFMKRFKEKAKTNNAESNTVAFLFVMVFSLMLTITIIDTGIYFLNRNIMSTAATNGARLVAVYGGTGNTADGTPIAKAYGSKADPSCVNKANPVVCSVEKELKGSPVSGNTSIKSISCGPVNTDKIGVRTWCEIKWQYDGMPGSAMSFIKGNQVNTTRLSAESEVIYDGK